MSLFTEVLKPGGGILLIPFIRTVISCLFMTTVTAFICGVARMHMAILSFLAGGLLWSISFFMGEYEKAVDSAKRKGRNGNGAAPVRSNEKTD
mmetsp:Transcript_20001/g.30276  ORF Transcript_20001/g.30276 Transcript_20001/m.30276 type:complete len:93 (+) Transcript_20001:169-447(+)|eukprot:CAMPEP_0194083714 /NCGR_PEP_ID=MMETSP0149-20130528/9724_1 /TAXON_ID=122233 /ORGANISM="Chaetoceros debilis, Strain MM31A-1" /LENGTH=92 /DNA_ID=CAMNT_0038766165 /DNA_START=160 /DNA_END=438 /DNA_ORIENTATION=-